MLSTLAETNRSFWNWLTFTWLYQSCVDLPIITKHLPSCSYIDPLFWWRDASCHPTLIQAPLRRCNDLYWRVRCFAHNLMWCDSTSCYARYGWIMFKINTKSLGQSVEMSKGQGGTMITCTFIDFSHELSSCITCLLWEVGTQENEIADFLFKNCIKYFQNRNSKCLNLRI